MGSTPPPEPKGLPVWAWFVLPAAAMLLVAGVGTALAGHPQHPASPLDPRFDTCTLAKDSGYGPYVRDIDLEYLWYRDGNNDGVVCD